jgi:Family of unknown function (DUF5995)
MTSAGLSGWIIIGHYLFCWEGGVATPQSEIVHRMAIQIHDWETVADQRSIFLSCYLLMTRNIISAIDNLEFRDSAWVNRLMDRFAGYYFAALEQYEKEPSSAPAVWHSAHDVSLAPHTLALQKLLAGINAHINYDLVLSLVDMLEPEWGGLGDDQRATRYQDHCHVNAVIGRTIDAVQDQILDPVMPSMVLIDELLGPVDEALVSHLIMHWRETVWRDAMQLLEQSEPGERERLIRKIERSALEIASLIG